MSCRSLADAIEGTESELTISHIVAISQQMCSGMEVRAWSCDHKVWCRQLQRMGLCTAAWPSAACCCLGLTRGQDVSRTSVKASTATSLSGDAPVQVSDYGLSVHTRGKTHMTVSGAELPLMIRC